MINELHIFFKEYEVLVASADSLFNRVHVQYPECVTCKIECSDCCYALFDLSLIEALYLNHHFGRIFTDQEKENLLEVANRADRKVYRIKRRIHRNLQGGDAEGDILERIAQERLRCPLLDDQSRCRMYAFRPITCRLYGIPTSFRGTAHTCGRSAFAVGALYPTVHLDAIHRRLLELSATLIKKLGSRHRKMADMLVPVSMALITVYDDKYLGLSHPEHISPEPVRSSNEPA